MDNDEDFVVVPSATDEGSSPGPAKTGAAPSSSLSLCSSFSSSLSLSSTKKPNNNFELKRWRAVAIWAWDVDVDKCAICRNKFNNNCLECEANQASGLRQPCNIVWGVCNHAFHLHCILKWLKDRLVCPLDNKEWVFLTSGY